MDGIVASCPQNLTDKVRASTGLGCGRDKYGNDQYLCIPNTEKTGLVEFCHNGTMGILDKGYCLEKAEGDKLSNRNCSEFITGCPDTHFHSEDIYKYPSCLRISTQHQCYLADPSCGNVIRNSTTEYTTEAFDPGFTTDHGMYNTTAMDIQTTAFPDDPGVYNTTAMDIQTTASPNADPALIGAIVGGSVVLIAILIIARVVWKRKQRQKQRGKDDISTVEESRMANINIQEQNEDEYKGETCLYDADFVPECERPLLSYGERTVKIQEKVVNIDPEEEEHGVTEAGVYDSNSETESDGLSIRSSDSKDYQSMGDYNLWRTKVSDQFSTLTDDEVFVLYSFLCSDSGPPDFTDTEWMDMLNELREDVYNKWDMLSYIRTTRYRKYVNPVTSDEAKQTLEKLKSRDFLWRDHYKITEDTKDETMYKIASIDSRIPFFYSSYDTASVYLRSEKYQRKPGEKCVIGYCDSIMIRRLQMNILTHVTMEDTDIDKKIHRELNIPYDIINDSKDKRKEFLMDLRKEGEAVNYRGRSQNSVQHVTWLWRRERPDVVRSCIGLHPHWDIYVIDNKAYRKPSDTYKSLEYLYRIPKQTLSTIIPETCTAIYNVLKVKYLKVPSTSEEWERIAEEFESKWNFPN